MSKYAKAYN